VNWDDAKAFAARLSKKTGKSYRLLSESEREYVTQAGTTTRYSFGDDENKLCQYGNVADRSAKNKIKGAEAWKFADCDDGYAYTAPVGQFAANPFGIHYVLGNVWDWTEDCWNDKYDGAPLDGSAWTSGDCSRRVLRGGSWDNNPQLLRAAIRFRYSTGYRINYIGFRLARTLHP
jgi:formylglycine-generating enzyme required for sulfatase activity